MPPHAEPEHHILWATPVLVGELKAALGAYVYASDCRAAFESCIHKSDSSSSISKLPVEMIDSIIKDVYIAVREVLLRKWAKKCTFWYLQTDDRASGWICQYIIENYQDGLDAMQGILKKFIFSECTQCAAIKSVSRLKWYREHLRSTLPVDGPDELEELIRVALAGNDDDIERMVAFMEEDDDDNDDNDDDDDNDGSDDNDDDDDIDDSDDDENSQALHDQGPIWCEACNAVYHHNYSYNAAPCSPLSDEYENDDIARQFQDILSTEDNPWNKHPERESFFRMLRSLDYELDNDAYYFERAVEEMEATYLHKVSDNEVLSAVERDALAKHFGLECQLFLQVGCDETTALLVSKGSHLHRPRKCDRYADMQLTTHGQALAPSLRLLQIPDLTAEEQQAFRKAEKDLHLTPCTHVRPPNRHSPDAEAASAQDLAEWPQLVWLEAEKSTTVV